MLAIEREPLYKNKFFIGAIALIFGFAVTLIGIRIIGGANDDAAESARTPSEERAATLIPVSSSGSESESEETSASAAPEQSAQPSNQSTASGNNWNSGWTAPTSTTSSSPSTPAPAASPTPTQSQPAPVSEPAQSQPEEGSTCPLLNGLGLPVVGTIVGGICTL